MCSKGADSAVGDSGGEVVMVMMLFVTGRSELIVGARGDLPSADATASPPAPASLAIEQQTRQMHVCLYISLNTHATAAPFSLDLLFLRFITT